MTQNISAFGTRAILVASSTFPAGVILSQFADDADSLDVPSQQVADKAMGVNGDLVVWSKANPLNIIMNVIPGSDDDRALSTLLEANRVARGKTSADDTITLTVIYPSGAQQTWVQGRITDGVPGNALASSGRMKSKPYAFTFEGLNRAAA